MGSDGMLTEEDLRRLREVVQCTSGEGGIRNRAGERWEVPADDGSTEIPGDPSAAGSSSSQGLPCDCSNVVNRQEPGQDPVVARVQGALDDARRAWRERADREALRSALLRLLELLEEVTP